jgi:hypothetical protein
MRELFFFVLGFTLKPTADDESTEEFGQPL